MPVRMHTNEVAVDAKLVNRLLQSQAPGLAADRELRIVEPWGTDNAIWRLGDDLVVRLPRMKWAINQVAFEDTWLPRLAPLIPIAVPAPVFVGGPAHGYPYPWAIHEWLPGQGAGPDTIADSMVFAHDLAAVVRSLWGIPSTDAPSAKNRARPTHQYDQSARAAIESTRGLIDVDAATAIWEEALDASSSGGEPVWVHGDLEGNCLVDNRGALSGLVDWGTACAGDPAVDVQVIWSPLFTEPSRHFFLDLLDVDEATIARSKGAAIQQACGALSYYFKTYPLIVERSWHKLEALGVPCTSGHQVRAVD